MDTFEAIQKRRSVRRFTGTDVPREDLLKIVEAGHCATTGHNKQPWDFIIITDRTMLQEISDRCSAWVSKAAAVIVVVVNPASRWWLEDGSAATENMLLAATDLGYGSCWLEGVMLSHEEHFKARLGIPEDRRILTFIPIGVPEAWPAGPAKKNLAEVVHWQRWGQKE
jgi:nitroreductase